MRPSLKFLGCTYFAHHDAEDQVQPNLITCNGVIDICQKTGELQVALGLLSFMSSSEVREGRNRMREDGVE